jgi:uncharacterized metal-binding protein
MPSGGTHDRITLWSLPLVTGVTVVCTRDGDLALLLAGGYLFGGLMFGPDLDIRSRQFLRWGLLRWLWLPYQRGLRHRSLLSHGPVLGTLGRLAYLGLWLGAVWSLGVFLWAIAQQGVGAAASWRAVAEPAWRSTLPWLWSLLQRYPQEAIALGLGLELGAMSHSLSDWLGSSYKRWRRDWQKHGWRSLVMAESGRRRSRLARGKNRAKKR